MPLRLLRGVSHTNLEYPASTGLQLWIAASGKKRQFADLLQGYRKRGEVHAGAASAHISDELLQVIDLAGHSRDPATDYFIWGSLAWTGQQLCGQLALQCEEILSQGAAGNGLPAPIHLKLLDLLENPVQ
jgi:hypothetical protein